MRAEYLLFNFIILSGPLIFSFDNKVAYHRKWVRALIASVLSLVPFIIWDALVTGRHWHFNPEFTTTLRFLGLPPGEWLFFITVPFACLFIWEIISTLVKTRQLFTIPFKIILPLSIGLMFFLYTSGKEYTLFVLTALLIIVIVDRILKTNILFQNRTIRLLMIVTGLIMIFNGYLTARPIVIYNDAMNLGIRIFTIPVEDFFYGISHVLLTVIFYERLDRFSWKK